MSWLTSPDDERVHVGLTMPELKTIIYSLMYLQNDPKIDLTMLETSAYMIDLFIQLENDLVDKLNHDKHEEDHARKYGEA